MKILIADDNPDDRILAIKELERHFGKVEVREVISERDLMEALENFDFDAVITDYRLRWGTGFDVLNSVRKVSHNVPVIMLTLTGNEEIAVEALKVGFDDYVLKSPKHMRRLGIAVEKAIDKKRREKELEEYYSKLQESEKRYRELWENANDILYIHDLEGRFTDVNRKALETFGYSKEDIGKITIKDVVDDESIEDALKVLEYIRNYGKSIEGPIILKCRTNEGKTIWVETRIQLVKENGKVVGVQGIARDITQRINYEREIERLNRLLRIANEINTIIVRERDEEELVRNVVSKLLDFYPSVFIGVVRNDEMVFEPSDIHDPECVNEALKSERPLELKPGEHIKGCRFIEIHGNFHVLTIPLKYGEKIKGVLVIHSEREFSEDEKEILTILSSDIAFAVESIRLEEERFLAYLQLEQNIEQFANLVDRIRNPLAVIYGLADVRIEDEDLRSRIFREVERIEEIIKTLEAGWLKSESLMDTMRKSLES